MSNSPTPAAAEWDHFAMRVAEKADRLSDNDDHTALTEIVYVIGNLSDEDRVMLTWALARHVASLLNSIFPGDIDERWRRVFELYPPA